MKNAKQTKAFQDVKERNEELYERFQNEFNNIITSDEPEGGNSRIQLLEQALHSMNSDIISSNLKYAGDMIESIDEDKIIESKKANSQRKG